MPLFPCIPLDVLLTQLTAEEQQEVQTIFQIATKNDGGRFIGPEESREKMQRHLIGMALYGYADRLYSFARIKLQQQEPGAAEPLKKALVAYFKARAVDSSQPVYLFGLARCLELAEMAPEAAEGYQAFIREQSRFPYDPSGQELIKAARESLSRLGRSLE